VKKVISLSLLLFGSLHALNVDEALAKLKSNNLEVQVASYELKEAKNKKDEAFGAYLGKLNLTQDIARSNDAGNVFGFKLTSREATFGDFGAKEFMNAAGPSLVASAAGTPTPIADSAYTNPPDRLNYPDAHNFFQTKLKYELPLYTGGKLSSYNDIMTAMIKMKSLDKKALMDEKIFELKKSFYNYKLLEQVSAKLAIIDTNMHTLQDTTKEMIKVGYAKDIDLLEIQAKMSSVSRVMHDVALNKKLLKQYIEFLLNEKVDSIEVSNLVDLQTPQFDDTNLEQSNSDIQKVKIAVGINKSMVSLNRSGYLPMVGAFAEVATADDTFLGDANDHKAYSMGARLTWNIFNGFSDSAKVEEAKVNLLKRETQYSLAKAGIKLKYLKMKTQIENDDNAIESLNQELKLVRTIRKNYSERYKEKLVSINDVLMKESQEIEKEMALLKAKNLRNEHILSLEKLVGEV